MELVKLSDRIFYLPPEEVNDRPVLGYVNGDRYSLAIDGGNSDKHVEKFYEELKKANLRLPDYTVITHWHWDHTFGMHAVLGKTIAGKPTNNKLKEVMTWKWSDEDMQNRLNTGEDIEMCDRCIKVEYPDREEIKVTTADIELNGSLKIDLGGVSCVITEFVAPHSEDSVLVYVPEEKTVFVGDAGCEDFYYNNGKYDKDKLEAFIESLKEIDFDTYVWGHDVPEAKESVISYFVEALEELK
ncbi:MBL fold metallo-hydrolase [Inconstantimicrobium mannanitabidum]|uniref:MBL fold hydrolase n=1 Tax=Inconstantimicrobium mannanitabidum TaxID=1604901 RepID=A0ACB5RCB5_9CLOT|nr:MBL fold metallo-hydrolase [Clostridium sp. TW13]GKX66519.1 MBL fold hydrolase [Clostridium sp. TW13]